jgi:hypothetical protein
MAFVTAPSVARATFTPKRGAAPTGRFGPYRPPSVVGVDPGNAILIRDMARRAKRAEAAWLKTLPKGVTV